MADRGTPESVGDMRSWGGTAFCKTFFNIQNVWTMIEDVLLGPKLGNVKQIQTGCLKTAGKVVGSVTLKVPKFMNSLQSSRSCPIHQLIII